MKKAFNMRAMIFEAADQDVNVWDIWGLWREKIAAGDIQMREYELRTITVEAIYASN